MIKLKNETSQLDPVVQARAGQPINRRRMLGLAVGTGIALAGTAIGPSRTAKAHSWLTVEVIPIILETIGEPAEGDVIPTGPFYAEGPLYPKAPWMKRHGPRRCPVDRHFSLLGVDLEWQRHLSLWLGESVI